MPYIQQARSYLLKDPKGNHMNEEEARPRGLGEGGIVESSFHRNRLVTGGVALPKG